MKNLYEFRLKTTPKNKYKITVLILKFSLKKFIENSHMWKKSKKYFSLLYRCLQRFFWTYAKNLC